MDVVGIGENSFDVVVRIPAPPVAGGKQPILSRQTTSGGQVATTLCTCAALGLRTAYLGAFGDDNAGRQVRETLAVRGVDLSASVTRRAPNRSALILVDEHTGGRTVFHQHDAALQLGREDLPANLVEGARVVHLDATYPELAVLAGSRARAAGRIVTTDVDGDDEVARALVLGATHPVMAEHVPLAMTGEPDLETALRALSLPHHAMLCVTLGERGSAMLAGDTFYIVPAVHVAVVDTTGAGDVFRGAFIHALLRGDAPEEILRLANATAAMSCTRDGAINH
jgi:sugar/nucleoside kinase (ribokinase family)